MDPIEVVDKFGLGGIVLWLLWQEIQKRKGHSTNHGKANPNNRVLEAKLTAHVEAFTTFCDGDALWKQRQDKVDDAFRLKFTATEKKIAEVAEACATLEGQLKSQE